MKKIICLCTVFVLLTGCQRMPDAVAEQQKSYGENPVLEDVEIRYCTVKELAAASMSDVGYIPDNLILPAQVDFSSVTDINIIDFAFAENYCEHAAEAADSLGIQNPEWTEFKGTLEGDTAVIYDSEQEEAYLAVGDNGQVSLLKNELYTDIGGEALELKHVFTYPAWQGSDFVCNLKQQQVRLDELAVRMEDYAAARGEIIGDFVPRVQAIYISEREDGKQRVSARLAFYYQGVVLDYFGGGIQEIDGISKVQQMDAYADLETESDREIDRFYNHARLLVQSEEKQEQVIDLESAVRLAEKQVSGFQKLTVAEVKAMYALYPQYDYESRTQYYAAPGNIVRARPVYCFMIPVAGNGQTDVLEEGARFCYVNIDMITGEVTTNLGEKGFVIQ